MKKDKETMPNVNSVALKIMRDQWGSMLPSKQIITSVTDLTDNEIEFLKYFAKGDSYDMISRRLHKSVPTLKGWRRKLMKSHGFKTTKELKTWFRKTF